MKYFLSVILLGVISDNVTAQLSARDITCQVQHRGNSWTGSCVDNSVVDYTRPFFKAPECAQVSPNAWCTFAEIPCEYRLQEGVCMNPVSACFSRTFTSAQFEFFSDKNNKLVYLCPGGLTCCINGQIAAPEPRPNLPGQLFPSPQDSSFTPEDPFSDEIPWAYDDSGSHTASLLTEPSYDGFLDPTEPNSDLFDSSHDWVSVFSDPNEETDYYSIQEQSKYNENDFLNTIEPNPYLTPSSNELISIFDDPSQDVDHYNIIPEEQYRDDVAFDLTGPGLWDEFVLSR